MGYLIGQKVFDVLKPEIVPEIAPKEIGLIRAEERKNILGRLTPYEPRCVAVFIEQAGIVPTGQVVCGRRMLRRTEYKLYPENKEIRLSGERVRYGNVFYEKIYLR